MEIKVLKKNMTPDIIEAIIDIDKEFYLNFDYKNEKSWYYHRYTDKNEAFCLYVDDKMVSYFIYYRISMMLFDQILGLKYEGDYYFPESEINVKSNYFYMPSVLVAKEYRIYSVPLLRRLIVESAKKDHQVVITVSREGQRLAEGKLAYIGDVNKAKNIKVYAKI